MSGIPASVAAAVEEVHRRLDEEETPEQAARRSKALANLIRHLPKRWATLQLAEDGGAWECPAKGLRVIASVNHELDGRLWLHVSVGRTYRALPSWDTLCEVKDDFCGAEATAYQVLPPRAKHVNLAEVLHLWCCLDGPVTPDFTRGTGSI
jgi:hypothetical protein